MGFMRDSLCIDFCESLLVCVCLCVGMCECVCVCVQVCEQERQHNRLSI